MSRKVPLRIWVGDKSWEKLQGGFEEKPMYRANAYKDKRSTCYGSEYVLAGSERKAVIRELREWASKQKRTINADYALMQKLKEMGK